MNTSPVTLPWPADRLTLEDWDRMPEDELFRFELVEGVLAIAAEPTSLHQRATMRLGYRLDEQLPTALTSSADVEVLVSDPPPTVRVPDVIVTDSALADEGTRR